MVGDNTPSFTVGAADNGRTNSIGAVVQDLIYHGCGNCGNVPIIRQGNDLSRGKITVNYVDEVCGEDGLCPLPASLGGVEAPGGPRSGLVPT